MIGYLVVFVGAGLGGVLRHFLNICIARLAGPHFPIIEGNPTLRDIEMKYILIVLEKHHGNKPAAAKELGISLKTLYNRFREYNG